MTPVGALDPLVLGAVRLVIGRLVGALLLTVLRAEDLGAGVVAAP